MINVVRSGTLLGYLSAAESVGLDGDAQLVRVGLDRSVLLNPDSFIPLDAFVRLLDISATESGRPDFGVRVAIARGVPDFGLISLLLREQETLGDALRTYIARLHHHSDGTYVSLDERFGNPFLSIRIASSYSTVQVTEFATCGLTHLIRWLVGSDWRPDAICHEHARPKTANIHTTFARCEVRYDQVLSGLLLGRDALKLKVVTSPQALRRQARQLIEQALDDAPDRFEVRVTQIINQQLHDGNCSVDSVASSLGTTRRTLHRKLAIQGLSYATLLQQVRIEAVKRFIELDSMSLLSVAELLGFGSPSVFSRWFRSSFGRSASDWRREEMARRSERHRRSPAQSNVS